MIVLVEEKHDIPLVEVDVLVRRGAAHDAVGQEGRARHAAELMRRGAGPRTRQELDEAVDSLGASLDVATAPDTIAVSGLVLNRNLPAFTDLLVDVLHRPRLDAEEHEKLVRELLAGLDDLRDDDASVTARFYDRMALRGHPYGRSGLGTTATIAARTREDAAAWIKDNVATDVVVLGMAGAVAARDVEVLASRLRDALPETAAPAPTIAPPPPPAGGRRTLLVDKPGRVQSQIIIGHAAPPPSHPDALALHVGATLFGGMFTSRLMNEVRVKRGWSYGASFRSTRARAGHAFRLRVSPSAAQTADTLALVLSEWERIVAEGATSDELDLAKSYLEGSFAFEIDTAGARLRRRIEELLFATPPYQSFVQRLAGIDLDTVNDAIRRWWRPLDARICITCTAETLGPALSRLPLGEIEVTAFDSY